VTHERQRPVPSFGWSNDSTRLLYAMDKNGDENTHVFSVDGNTLETKDLTPFEKTQGRIDATQPPHRDHPPPPSSGLPQRCATDAAWHGRPSDIARQAIVDVRAVSASGSRRAVVWRRRKSRAVTEELMAKPFVGRTALTPIA
jgi:hypothetical protein